jgi:hypothetical protein
MDFNSLTSGAKLIERIDQPTNIKVLITLSQDKTFLVIVVAVRNNQCLIRHFTSKKMQES